MPAQHREFFETCLSMMFVGISQPPAAGLLPANDIVPFFAGSVDAAGRVWASVLPGMPGFVKSPTDTTLHVRTPVPPHDPLFESLEPGALVGLLGLQLHTRRRNRANGKIARVHDGGRGGFDFQLDIAFGNCPKVPFFFFLFKYHMNSEEA
jgi:predicted pyridoxine 5'-phosphate oxidase superfamily flavin-nucleotide-binding protein